MPFDELKGLQDSDRSYQFHPFTDHRSMHASGTHIISAGQGCFVVEQNGNRLLDALAGLWCVNVGYGRQEIISAVCDQLQTLSFYPSFFNSTTEPSIRLSEVLANLAPGKLQYTFFCGSGSEANESALKAVRAYNHIKGRTKKRKILSRTYAYHGVTLGSSSLTGLPSCHTAFDLPLPEFLHAPAPYPWEAGRDDPDVFALECLEQTKQLILKEGADTIAAMFAEPIQGAGGVIIPPREYYSQLRDLCLENDILFVADEVITGFGRLGAWFACDLWNIEPDMLTMAKGITSGYVPLGALMFTDQIAQVLNDGGLFAHGFTYSGHPVATRAALANIDILKNEQILTTVLEERGPYFQKKITELAAHPAVGQVRSDGLIAAIELIPREGRKGLTASLNLGARAAQLVREEGAIVRGIRNLIALAPPLVITTSEIDQLQDSIVRALDRFW